MLQGLANVLGRGRVGARDCGASDALDEEALDVRARKLRRQGREIVLVDIDIVFPRHRHEHFFTCRFGLGWEERNVHFAPPLTFQVDGEEIRPAGEKHPQNFSPEFVAFLDADDLWHKEKNERQFARFTARPELDLSASYSQNFWIPELKAEAGAPENKLFAEPRLGATGAALIRRSLFDRVGFFDPGNTHRDYLDWLARAREQSAIVETMPEVLLFRRIHHDNLSRDRSTFDHDDMIRTVKASLERRRRVAGKQPQARNGRSHHK